MQGSHRECVGVRKVCVNVGGQEFTTYAETFMRCPGSLLGTMYADANKNLLQEDTPFFDRNPKAFGAIIEWYRVGMLVMPSTLLTVDAMLVELDFWQIPLQRSQIYSSFSCGERVKMKAIAAAERRVEPLISKMEELCIRACEAAAMEGCRSCFFFHSSLHIPFCRFDPFVEAFVFLF
jgi:hypothetical protein